MVMGYKKFEFAGLLMDVETFQDSRSGEPKCRVVLGFMGDQMRLNADPNRHIEFKQLLNKEVVCAGTVDHQLKTFGSKADERYTFTLETVKKSTDK